MLKSSVAYLGCATVVIAMLALLACGDDGGELAASSTAPPGMFSTLPTEESPVLGDQPPTIELNTPEPTLTPDPTPTPNPTYTPVPTLTPLPSATPIPTLAPTGTPVPTKVPTPEPTATPVPTLVPTPNPTATPVPTLVPTPNPTATPQPTYTPAPTTAPTRAPRPTAAPSGPGNSAGLKQALCAAVIGRVTDENVSTANALLRAGANPDAKCGSEDRPQPALFWAIIGSEGDFRIVNALVGSGANVNARDRKGTPLLFWAIDDEPYSAEMVQILVDAGANGNATDEDGRSMVYWATIQELPVIVVILVTGGS